ncbi:discoidin domain-containing protein [Ancylomarina salipaludis]|uniref:Discoidin domain-containing protein n=1 Tax=Ancylomarina salipaludis TaxID=2501299 RepID=A0A4Q1JMN1_9BACT|nr:discoidin domain-containing protein [Ancylomarina salipaludis]RXQ94539.1 discoidin domain-containing protein [Ancylomarina salipaludis]
MKNQKVKKSNYQKFIKMDFKRISFLLFAIVVMSFITSCDKDDTVNLPVTTTGEVTDITGQDAVVSGSVTSNGGSKILAMGVCFTTEDREPTVADNFAEVGEFTLDGILEKDWNYSATLKGLAVKTAYKARAYASNEAGTAYGETISFTSKAGKTFHTLRDDMIDTFTQEGSEGPKEALIDDNFDTYWHSAWSDGVAPLPHHIQITFDEAKNIGGFQFWTRSTSNRGNDPVKFDVQTSTNGTDYTTVWTSETIETQPRPADNTISLDKNYSSKYFRIRVLDTRTTGLTHTTISEIKVFDDGMLPY